MVKSPRLRSSRGNETFNRKCRWLWLQLRYQQGIIEAHTKGIVTVHLQWWTQLPHTKQKTWLSFPTCPIGLHFEVKEIINVQVELDRQIKKFISIVGKEPDHLDSHKKHTTTRGIKEVLEAYSAKHNVPVRNFGNAKFIDVFFGFHSNGDVSVGQLERAIDLATDEYNGIMCHVGYFDDYLREHSSYSDSREQELASICDPTIKQYIAEKGLESFNWRQVAVNL